MLDALLAAGAPKGLPVDAVADEPPNTDEPPPNKFVVAVVAFGDPKTFVAPPPNTDCSGLGNVAAAAPPNMLLPAGGGPGF